MASAWRICLARHGATAFSGGGARAHGGRWNAKGTALSYASATLSLAALEILVHADVDLLRSASLVACVASWPDSLRTEKLAASLLPGAWRDTPAPPALAALGDRWIREARSAILFVPSAVVTAEHDVLINPAHADAKRIGFGKPEPFAFDRT